MSRWPLVPLGEVLTQFGEYIDAPEPKAYPKLSVKLYGRGVALDAPADGASLRMKRHQLAKAGQVILSEIWGKKGAIGFVPPEGDGALCTSHFFLFDIDGARLEPRWLNCIFQANYLQEQLDAEAKGTTGYAAVRPAHLLKAVIPLPPPEEQRRLIQRIDALAAKIADAQSLRRDATEAASALMKSAMRSVFQRLDVKQTTALHQVCAAIIDCLHSNPVYSDGGMPTVRSPDVGWGRLNLATALKTDEAEYRRRTMRGEPRAGDIVIVREGGGTGKAGLVEEGQRLSLGQRVMMLRPDTSKIEPRFLLYQWLSPLVFEEQIVGRMMGSASPHLNIGAAKQFQLRVPALDQQRRVVSYLDQLRAEADALRQQQEEAGEELDAMRPAILDRAFKGEL